ncbi:hypothetical protein [Arthrobacter sp. ok362]|uniref:hypothetical protein n=1 Tax=Arthrobacter sp. ok362 TaxID=1761745 RepID=UPI000885E498|nr:hypothetical protein [Arthrobacter sp. ok362]SDL99661.1 hypothetical protein SAMN04487913_12016 [Arthrobacter sp. ok362]
MNLRICLGMLHQAEQTRADSFRQVAGGHGAQPDVDFLCLRLAGQCDRPPRTAPAGPAAIRRDTSDNEPMRLHAEGLSETRSGRVGLLRDLEDLYLLASLVDVTWTIIKQAGSALRDHELLAVVEKCDAETAVQLRWLKTRMKQAAPKASVAAR